MLLTTPSRSTDAAPGYSAPGGGGGASRARSRAACRLVEAALLLLLPGGCSGAAPARRGHGRAGGGQTGDDCGGGGGDGFRLACRALCVILGVYITLPYVASAILNGFLKFLAVKDLFRS